MSDSERVWQKFSKFSLASNNSGVLGVFRVRTKLLCHNFNTCETTFVAILQSVSLACKLQAPVCRADALSHQIFSALSLSRRLTLHRSPVQWT